jgi:hypothetical protein
MSLLLNMAIRDDIVSHSEWGCADEIEIDAKTNRVTGTFVCNFFCSEGQMRL